MMEEGRKRPSAYDISGECSWKKARSPATSDDGSSDDSEDIFASLTVLDEEAVGELMKLLEEKEVAISSSPVAAAKVKFIDNPYSTPSVFQSSSAYVTINGNEESCGSSFSDSDSSVMVSIDVGGVFINNGCAGGGSKAFGAVWGFQAAEIGGACGEEDEVVARYLVTNTGEDGEKSVDGMNGGDGFDLDDVLLARFLGEDVF